MKKLTSILIFALSGALFAAQPTGPESDTLKKIKPLELGNIGLSDDPYSAQLDSLLNFSFFVTDASFEATTDFVAADTDSLVTIPDFHDSIYRDRLSLLNEKTPFELDYNPYVRRYIEVYSKNRREQVSRMMGLAEYYFPMFEEMLDRYEMPLELKYLAIVESALNPNARSRMGATGLWQFMYATGKMHGLKVSSYVDERSDPLKSTEAACQYLKTLYNIFGDWNLALAAYNSGPGNVNKAIRRSGGKKSYWELRPFLPRETAGYVPAFIAVNYIMNYSDEHMLFATDVKPSYFQTDTIAIREKISFEQISKLIDISEEELSFLNPSYRYKVIPKDSDEPYSLVLPSTKIGTFITNEDSIYALAQKDFEQHSAPTASAEVSDRIRHRVQRGEVLGTIAERYGVSVSSIRRWNGIRGNTIRIGQSLTIHPRKVPASTTASSSTSEGSVNYRVSSGETFYSIARKYPGVTAEKIMGWNNINDARHLKVGMRLKIYPNS